MNNRLSVVTDNAANAKKLADFLKSIGYVKSVDLDKPMKPLEGDDWIKPGRPATDDELERMCLEMENEEGGYTVEEAKAKTLKEIKQWRKQR